MASKIDREEFEPEIVVLYCQNCLEKDEELKATLNEISGFRAQFLIMPCTSKVEASHVLKILAEGADGVLVVGCKPDHCQFLIGNTMAEKRVQQARRFLDEIHMGAERAGMDRGEGLSPLQVVTLAELRADAVRPLGPNPMKGVGNR